MDINEHITLFAKGHYKEYSLKDVVGKYTGIRPKDVEDKDVQHFVIDTFVKVFKDKPGKLEDFLGGLFCSETLTPKTLTEKMLSYLRNTRVSDLPFILGEADLFR